MFTVYAIPVVVNGHRWYRRVLYFIALTRPAAVHWFDTYTCMTCVLYGEENVRNGEKGRQRKGRKISNSRVVNSVEELRVQADIAKNRDKNKKDTMSSANEWKLTLGSTSRPPPTGSHPSRTKSSVPVRLRPKILAAVTIMIVIILTYLLLPNAKYTNGDLILHSVSDYVWRNSEYNKTYPMTPPERTLDGQRFQIGLISDRDTASKLTGKESTWVSFYLKGYLNINSLHDQVSIQLDKEPLDLKSQLSQGGRGMELSELITFNGKLYAIDDRTGVIYQIIGNRVVPWTILSDGDGRNTKGFKGEWMAMRDQTLFVGGLGKEWTTTTGEIVNLNPQWVKMVQRDGSVHHLNWVKNYNAMRDQGGYPYPGYMIHESGTWSDVHNRWFFMPRRASKEKYTEVDDEHRATNLLISCNADFSDIRFNKIGGLNKIRGFSSFKFVPGTKDTVIVALKTEEDQGKIATYYTVFNISGKTLIPDTKFADIKYEGIEFI